MPSGGYRPGAARPRKNPIDKKLEGKPVGTNGGSQPKPKKVNSKNVMADYFSLAMKECEKEVPSADALRNEIEEYITARGCDGYVAPQTITDYVLNRQGFLACEAMNRKIGRMTKDLKLSPYVTAGAQYYKAMQGDFNLIMQIINPSPVYLVIVSTPSKGILNSLPKQRHPTLNGSQRTAAVRHKGGDADRL